MPVAVAGADRTLELGATTILHGVGSFDPDGDELSYLWVDGQGAVVSDSDTVPISPPLGTHVYELTVTDVHGALSQQSVTIRVEDTVPPAVAVLAPVDSVVLAGKPVAIRWTAADIGTVVRFDLSSSTDGGMTYVPIPQCSELPGDRSECEWTSVGPAASPTIVRVVAIDGSGNSGVGESSLTIYDQIAIRVQQGTDDAAQRKDGKTDVGGSRLALGNRHVGLRFAGVELPRGAVILNARLQLVAERSSDRATSLTIEGEASDDAVPFTKTKNNISARASTEASVEWAPSPWVKNLTYDSPGVETILQEIVDRPSWASGNAVVLKLPRKHGKREAQSFERSPERAPVLFIEFTLRTDIP